MSRQRILEIILAIVAIGSFPPLLIRMWFSHAGAPKAVAPSAAQIQFRAAFQDGLQLERDNQCEAAIPKFREAEMYASRMEADKYNSMRSSLERVAACGLALGRDEDVRGANTRFIGTLIDEGESLRRSNHLEEALSKLQEAEQRLEQLTPPNENYLKADRDELIAVYWRLKRYQDVEGVYARMIESVRQPLNDYRSVLGEKHMEIAMTRSRYDDCAGAERSCQQAIEEFDRTIGTYSGTDASGLPLTAAARGAKSVAMYWLEIAYARQSKAESALSAAENVFQYNQQLNGSYGLARDISKLAVQVAKDAQKQDAIQQWQQRLNSLPAEPCPVPNIHNPACIKPVAPATPPA